MFLNRSTCFLRFFPPHLSLSRQSHGAPYRAHGVRTARPRARRARRSTARCSAKAAGFERARFERAEHLRSSSSLGNPFHLTSVINQTSHSSCTLRLDVKIHSSPVLLRVVLLNQKQTKVHSTPWGWWAFWCFCSCVVARRGRRDPSQTWDVTTGFERF